jgi:NAD(P)-dependent dehydrogenase (short-subunit alcohol dehydrogenase family)
MASVWELPGRVSNAGMNVVIGYRNEKRLALAMPLFAKDAPVYPVKHDVIGRDGWVQLLDSVKAKYGKLHVVVNNAGHQDAEEGNGGDGRRLAGFD